LIELQIPARYLEGLYRQKRLTKESSTASNVANVSARKVYEQNLREEPTKDQKADYGRMREATKGLHHKYSPPINANLLLALSNRLAIKLKLLPSLIDVFQTIYHEGRFVAFVLVIIRCQQRVAIMIVLLHSP